MVKAPIYRTRRDPEFAQEILDRLLGSRTFLDHLAKTGAGGRVVPVAFPRPGPNWYREHHGVPQVSVFVMLAALPSEDAPIADLFVEDRRDLTGAFTVEIDFAVAPPADSARDVETIGPLRDLEERWTFFLSGL
jgi:hypothetical protein